MKVEFTVPELKKYPQIPVLVKDAMAHSQPFKAGRQQQQSLGYPGELVADWHPKAIAKMAELLGQYRGLRVFMDTCIKCGACTDKCHYFLGTADPKNMPVARQDLLRAVYRRYFTFAGKYFPKLVGAVDLTEEVIADWYKYFYQCSECRRCAGFCPIGIDTAEITMAAREILNHIGVGQKYSQEILTKVHKTGNNLGMQQPALVNTLESLEEDLAAETGAAIKLPIDVPGAEVLLLTPSADFFAEPHIDGLLGYAKVFHRAGISWTLSSYATEAANFGLFTGSYAQLQQAAGRVRSAALELGVRRIVIGECGHAWRVAYSFWNTLIGPFDFLDKNYPIPQHICELSYDLIQRGALTFDRAAHDDKIITFHDSCNVARGARMGNIAGGQFTIPRAIIKACSPHFVDMAADTIGANTFCCGGGGGLLTDDLLELRVKGAMPRAQALQRVIEDHGVTHMAAICAICKSQFSTVLPIYGMDMGMVVSLHQLVGEALILSNEH